MKLKTLQLSLLIILLTINIASAEDVCKKLIPQSLVKEINHTFPLYRIALSADQKSDDPEWNKYYYTKDTCQTVVTADFDGNGGVDFALYLVKKDSTSPLLIAALSSGQRWNIRQLRQWNDHIIGCYIALVKPGLYEHTLSYEFSPSDPFERKGIKSKNTSIVAGKVDSTGIVYVYEKGQWLYVWVSD